MQNDKRAAILVIVLRKISILVMRQNPCSNLGERLIKVNHIFMLEASGL